MVDVNLVLRQIQGSGTRLKMVILDACRNNPFGARGLRFADGGLAQMRAPEGTLISYTTQPGSVAMDGSDGRSPDTRRHRRQQRPCIRPQRLRNVQGLRRMLRTVDLDEAVSGRSTRMVIEPDELNRRGDAACCVVPARLARRRNTGWGRR